MQKQVIIIGGGLAGSECAWQLVNAGVKVKMFEMRGSKPTSVHKTDKLAELVCSNSFRGADKSKNAVGMLHHELRSLNSLIIKSADDNAVPAGGALAMDRELFSQQVQDTLLNHELFSLERREITSLDEVKDDIIVIATGPLTSENLAKNILNLTGEDSIEFFDAVAPIVAADSIDMSKAWKQSRYDKGDADYINCGMNKEEYYNFINAITKAEEAVAHNPDDKYFDGCLPIEVMIERGPETLRFGPLKPKGLTNAHNPEEKPYAVVQLRMDNKLGTLYNMVGFQTRLKWGEQNRIFKMIPGLENADFERFGVIHKNTFINSPKLLNADLSMKKHPHIHFAGQVSGVEGYVESTAMGCLTGRILAAKVKDETFNLPPETTMLGGLIRHITGNADVKTFQPMNITYGLLPPLETTRFENGRKMKKTDRKEQHSIRSEKHFNEWLKTL